jgi:hypothetical protein
MQKKEKKVKKLVEAGEETLFWAEEIRKASEGLWYISETDAEIQPFVGKKAENVTKEELLKQIGKESDTPVEEREFSELFERLTKIQDWFGEEEKIAADKFASLKELLEGNLRDLRVFKVGRIELDIYVVGINSEGILMGIKTKAVET